MDAYIVKAYRTAVGKAKRGSFKFTRADDLGAELIRHIMSEIPQLDNERIDDVIAGCATPEAEQGLNIGRMISLMGLDTVKVPGMTINRYCSSGLESIAIATAKIASGMSSCILAGGAETMSPIPFGGWKIMPNANVAQKHPDWYWGMGLTAEAVARDFNISRDEQDEFAMNSNIKAVRAVAEGRFKDDILPINIKETYLDENEKQQTKEYVMDTDEGPRDGTTMEKLARLRPVFDAKGSVTAGNASQTSDGAAFTMVMSGAMVKELNIKPIARMVAYSVSGVEPRVMGIGPVEAIPKAVKNAGLKLNDIELFELNEAFASQSVAVIKELDLNPDIVNVNGGAIALGHPLGCTGTKLSVQLFNEMKKRKQKYGVVTMCVGAGQGAAAVYEMLD
ncbi:MAG: acetyl-CoA C-acyltransferase [Flavobacteriales bacterium]|nr:acetyl-CoA C-acyltransferase [Flavobacteriales bacterium]